mgnify:FL=1
MYGQLLQYIFPDSWHREVKRINLQFMSRTSSTNFSETEGFINDTINPHLQYA